MAMVKSVHSTKITSRARTGRRKETEVRIAPYAEVIAHVRVRQRRLSRRPCEKTPLLECLTQWSVVQDKTFQNGKTIQETT
jgi:hypothetical protein